MASKHLNDKIYGYGQRDIERIQRAVRTVEDQFHRLKSFRRVRGAPKGGSGGGGVVIDWIKITSSSSHPMSGVLTYLNPTTGLWEDTQTVVSIYRYPTHTSNNMYPPSSITYKCIVPGYKIADGVYIALHSVPREFELYTQELP